MTENESRIKELKDIRKMYKAGRNQFGKVFLGGLSGMMVYYYETGHTHIPDSVIIMARIWKNCLEKFREGELQ